jgi:hypothetical protein
VRIRKVFVEKLAEQNSLARAPISRSARGTGPAGPTPDVREHLHRAGVRPLIQGGKPYPGRMLTPEPLEPVNDWQTALAVVAHPDDLVFDRAVAVARWTSRASTSCTAC